MTKSLYSFSGTIGNCMVDLKKAIDTINIADCHKPLFTRTMLTHNNEQYPVLQSNTPCDYCINNDTQVLCPCGDDYPIFIGRKVTL